nr:ABC transporter substrate-binding protein [Actinopolymorpha pittospori]
MSGRAWRCPAARVDDPVGAGRRAPGAAAGPGAGPVAGALAGESECGAVFGGFPVEAGAARRHRSALRGRRISAGGSARRRGRPSVRAVGVAGATRTACWRGWSRRTTVAGSAGVVARAGAGGGVGGAVRRRGRGPVGGATARRRRGPGGGRFNREEARKSIYFNTGETTTGTLSPKGPTFQIDDQGRQIYRQWRDSYIAHDPSTAKAMLDEIGVVDKDGDGYRELLSGGKLVVRIDYPADASTEHVQKNDLLRRDWEAVGIKVQINPLPPATYPDQWRRGELMSQPAWEVGDNAPLVYPGWVIPGEPAHWAPLHGQAFMLKARDPEAMEKEKAVDPWKRRPPWLLPEDGRHDRPAVEPVQPGAGRGRRAEAYEALLGRLQDPHRGGPVPDGLRGELSDRPPGPRRSQERTKAREPRPRRMDQPVAPPHPRGLRPGDLLLAGPQPARLNARTDGDAVAHPVASSSIAW